MAEEGGVVGQDHAIGIPEAQQGEHGPHAAVVRQHVLHSEAVHADRGPFVHQLTQVGKVLGIARVPDDHPIEGYAVLAEEGLLDEPCPGRRMRVRRDRHPGLLVRDRRGRHHPRDVVGHAGFVGHDLEHGRPDPGATDADLDVPHEQVDQGVWPGDRATRTAEAVVERERGRGIEAGRCDQVDRDAARHLRNNAHVAPQTRHGEVDDGADAERMERGQAPHGPLHGIGLVPLGTRPVQLQLQVPHEHVLVQQGGSELVRRQRPTVRLDGSHCSAHPPLIRCATYSRDGATPSRRPFRPAVGTDAA